MSNKTYDRFKAFALYILPAIGTLYVAVSKIWHLPFGEEVLATITALDTFLGVCVKVLADNYNKSQEDDDGEHTKLDSPS